MKLIVKVKSWISSEVGPCCFLRLCSHWIFHRQFRYGTKVFLWKRRCSLSLPHKLTYLMMCHIHKLYTYTRLTVFIRSSKALLTSMHRQQEAEKMRWTNIWIQIQMRCEWIEEACIWSGYDFFFHRRNNVRFTANYPIRPDARACELTNPTFLSLSRLASFVLPICFYLSYPFWPFELGVYFAA